MGNVADYMGGWPQTLPQRSYAVGMSVGLSGLRETRRSWTAKDKPHICRHPGCDKSYFYLHDLRRHEKQKQHGVAGGDGENRENSGGETDGQRLDGQGPDMSPQDVSELMTQSGHDGSANTAVQQEVSLLDG